MFARSYRAARARENAMRQLTAGCLLLFLGPWTMHALADERPGNGDRAEPDRAAAALGRPVALSCVPSATSGRATVTPASFESVNIGIPRTVVRAQSADFPQPLPAGPERLFGPRMQS